MFMYKPLEKSNGLRKSSACSALGKPAFSSAIGRTVPPCPLTLLFGVRVPWVVLGARAPDHCYEPQIALNHGRTVWNRRGR